MAAKRLAFKIPLQSEVEVYIKAKKNWPDQFVKYYTERFWNFYASNGWKVSGRAAMRDWKAAFNSNWQNLKYAEDIEMLKKYGGVPDQARVVHIATGRPIQNEPPPPQTQIEQLEEVLRWYKENPEKWNREALQAWPYLNDCYQAIKENRLWCPDITKQDIEKIKSESGDENYLKAYIVHRTFVYYGLSGWVFQDTLNTRNAAK